MGSSTSVETLRLGSRGSVSGGGRSASFAIPSYLVTNSLTLEDFCSTGVLSPSLFTTATGSESSEAASSPLASLAFSSSGSAVVAGSIFIDSSSPLGISSAISGVGSSCSIVVGSIIVGVSSTVAQASCSSASSPIAFFVSFSLSSFRTCRSPKLTAESVVPSLASPQGGANPSSVFPSPSPSFVSPQALSLPSSKPPHSSSSAVSACAKPFAAPPHGELSSAPKPCIPRPPFA